MRELLFALLAAGSVFGQGMVVGGTVVHGKTGAPLAGVQVTLRHPEAGVLPGGEFRTGTDGRFRFEVKPGRYVLTGERNGFGMQFYGGRTFTETTGVLLIPKPEANFENLVFRLIPPSAIGGRVTDQDGDPAERVLVELVRMTVMDGTRTAVNRGYAYTNDRGEYRFANLPEGTYYLVASGTPWVSERQWRGDVTQR